MRRTRFLSALLFVSALSMVSCSSGDDGPSGLSSEPSLIGTLGSGLLACTPLPHAMTQQTVGPEGGTLVVGPHRLTIPAGALSTAVQITAEAPVGTVNSVRLTPEGLTFAAGKPATLTLSYANCPLLGQLLPKRIAYTTDLLAILSYVMSVDDLIAKRVSGTLAHFSRYAVAW
jgi:hypothetical protein